MTQPDDSLALTAVDEQIANTEALIAKLNRHLEYAKGEVQRWVEENSSLSLSAAKARAETQSYGRGLGGALLGSKYRASARRIAASENARIAKEVSERRARIKQGKQNAQEVVRQTQAQLTLHKNELKALKAQRKELVSVNKSTHNIQASNRSLILLEKLSEAYQMGLLTDAEYEEKRKKIVDQI